MTEEEERDATLELQKTLSDKALCLGLLEVAERAAQNQATKGYTVFLLAAAERISRKIK